MHADILSIPDCSPRRASRACGTAARGRIQTHPDADGRGRSILRLAVWRNVAVFLATRAPGACCTSDLLQSAALGAPRPRRVGASRRLAVGSRAAQRRLCRPRGQILGGGVRERQDQRRVARDGNRDTLPMVLSVWTEVRPRWRLRRIGSTLQKARSKK